MAFASKSRKAPGVVASAVRRHPFAFFGLPFIGVVVVASYALETFTQTRYDLDNQKRSTVTKEEELGMDRNRKKIDIREEYYRLNAPAGTDSALDALSTTSLDTSAARKKKKFSMAATSQDEYEPVRVPRPAGVSEWGGVGEASEDAPIKGHRKEDRWV